MSLDRRQLWLLAMLTLCWGLNWPVMKIGATEFPPLSFRALSMWIGLPVLALVLLWQRVPFAIERRHWRELLTLTAANMLVWHVLAILAVRELRSREPIAFRARGEREGATGRRFTPMELVDADGSAPWRARRPETA